nr:MAG TPA: hypothetical protein [Caudoviricetes sp.]
MGELISQVLNHRWQVRSPAGRSATGTVDDVRQVSLVFNVKA